MQDALLSQSELSARHRRGIARRLDQIITEVKDLRCAVLTLLDERQRAAERQRSSERHQHDH